MTPRILLRLVTTALVAASLLPAQSAPTPSARAGEKPKSEAKPDERVQVRLAEVIAMLEEDDLTDAQRADAKKKLQEIVARLRKTNTAKGVDNVGPLHARIVETAPEPTVVRGRLLDVAPLSREVVEGKPIELKVVRRNLTGATADTPKVVEGHKVLFAEQSPEGQLHVVEAPKNVRVRVIESEGGEHHVMVAPQEPVPPTEPAGPTPPKAQKAAKAPKAPKAPKAAEAPAAPEGTGPLWRLRMEAASAESPPDVVEVPPRSGGSFTRMRRLEGAKGAVVVETGEGEPAEVRVLQLNPHGQAGATWLRQADVLDRAKAQLGRGEMAKAEAEAHAHHEAAKAAHSAAQSAHEVAKAHHERAKAYDTARTVEVRSRDSAARASADALRGEAEKVRKAAAELRVAKPRSAQPSRNRAPAAAPHADSDAEIRALIEEMRAEMRAIREMMQQLRERSDREDQEQAHFLFHSDKGADSAVAVPGRKVWTTTAGSLMGSQAFPGFRAMKAIPGGSLQAPGMKFTPLKGQDTPGFTLFGTATTGSSGGDGSSACCEAAEAACCTESECTATSSSGCCTATGSGSAAGSSTGTGCCTGATTSNKVSAGHGSSAHGPTFAR